MRDIAIRLPKAVDCRDVERAIDKALLDCGLTVTLRGSLKKFPGCIHWHAKNGKQPGTLEITLWPPEQRAWFTIQSGRTAPWIDGTVRRLAKAIRASL